ncbi:MAG: response regulator [Leptospiraceae bacterium]|nr:response regulator [Leptospiraceae bacterium]MCP5496621.1 response regulator [Leptospiraceae bacterium]
MKKIDRLYIIDDDEIFHFITKEIVNSTNLVENVETFSDGFKAINVLKSVQNTPQRLPEMILLDLNMPILDGWGFLEEYIALKPKLPKKITIFIVSSSIDPIDVEKAKSIHEVKDYIIKPLNEDKFLEIIEGLKTDNNL